MLLPEARELRPQLRFVVIRHCAAARGRDPAPTRLATATQDLVSPERSGFSS